jgi:hypothetical protein
MGTGGAELIPDATKQQPMRKLTKEQKRDIRAIAAKKDDDIDFSDVPRVIDWSVGEIGKFYRPKKKPTIKAGLPRFPNKSKQPHQK